VTTPAPPNATAYRGATIVTPAGPVEGWLEVADGRIERLVVGSVEPPPDHAVDLGGGWLVPGFLDLHCHGGAGADFGSGRAEELTRASAFHERHGSTGLLASLVTAPVAELCTQLAAVADLVELGSTNVLGAHLEGPFLSGARCGAQNPDHLIAPDVGAFADLLAAARGTLRMITIAPELPGALKLIDAVVAAGVVAAVGHTDASYAQACAAFERGASVATHLFNGMRPIHHRDPGPVLAALNSGAGCEVINDGVHVHPAVLRLVTDRDPRQLILITDSISAAGDGDGEFLLGGQRVQVSDGQARLRRSGSLAGSSLTTDDAVRRAVTVAGVSIAAAVAAASTNPARVIGMSQERGAIAVGLAADLVHLDTDLVPTAVIRAGVVRAAVCS